MPLLSGLQWLQDFKGREIFLLNKGVELRDHQKLVGKYLSFPATEKCSCESFGNGFPVAPSMVQIWDEKTPE